MQKSEQDEIKKFFGSKRKPIYKNCLGKKAKNPFLARATVQTIFYLTLNKNDASEFLT
jgi:hypothetical protein